VLEPGDMLYLPPGWAHEGTALGGDCTTASIGFRAPARDELAQALLERLADEAPAEHSPRYGDRSQRATDHPGALPDALRRFARAAVQQRVRAPGAIDRALGQWLTEPKAQVWFDADEGAGLSRARGVVLDRRTRMAYVGREVFINGESFSAGGRDAVLVRRLADARCLSADELRRASDEARAQIAEWLRAGWLHASSNDADA
jgi:50S ribosomal protein L16 3-hydroxylase